MKKTMPRLLTVLLLLTALAIGSAAPARAAESFSPEGGVVFEKDGVRVTTAGLDLDPYSEDGDPIVWVDVENTGEKELWLGAAGGCVNGFTGSVFLVDYTVEDGRYYGAEETVCLSVPAGAAGRYALGCRAASVPGLDMKTLSELELSFTLAEEEFTAPYFRAEPVVIVTGEEAGAVALETLGTVVLDNEDMLLVIGEQDYDAWFGPYINLYAENRSERYIGVSGDSAEADGVACDYLLGGLTMAPGKRAASSFMFDGPIRETKGFENLTLSLSLFEAADEDGLYSAQERTALAPVHIQYPPQVWGEYENGGLILEIQPKYNDLITVETPADDENGVLFSVSETASLEAGKFEGAGWLFAVAAVSEERLHDMLCQDMSGAVAFAKDDTGRFYVYYHPTDVRYERATVEELRRDQDRWIMLCQWAGTVRDTFTEQNGLEHVAYGNSDVEIWLARAAWMEGAKRTLSTTQFGPVPADGVDGTPYVESILQGGFIEAEPDETPDGEYVVLAFPDEEDTRLDFFFAPGGYIRLTSGSRETLYQAFWYDDDRTPAEIMQEWYYAAAEKAGIKKTG